MKSASLINSIFLLSSMRVHHPLVKMEPSTTGVSQKVMGPQTISACAMEQITNSASLKVLTELCVMVL